MKKTFLTLLCLMFYFFITFITKTLNIFLPYTNIYLSLIFIVFIFSLYYKNKNISLYSYILFTLVFLFLRTRAENNINGDFYLFKWLKIIFKNKIVLINILGNVLLFMPYCFLIRSKYYLFFIICSILSLEIIQYLTKLGVLDIVDITLNVFGCIIAIPLRWRLYGR